MSGRDEAALRGLVGAGPSQLSVSAALRARDAQRLSADDIETAEQTVVIRRAAARPDQPRERS